MFSRSKYKNLGSCYRFSPRLGSSPRKCSNNTNVRRNGPSDPGPRGGTCRGRARRGSEQRQACWPRSTLDRSDFQEVENVKDDGLGPRFNSNSCVSCHSQPALGGTSPAANPQVQFANSQNRLPSFITPDGPAREVRFIKKRDGTPDGGVHALFTIGGRADQPSGCNLTQEDFSDTSNMIFRIATPTFGLGLIEAIPDSTLQQNLDSNGGGAARHRRPTEPEWKRRHGDALWLEGAEQVPAALRG